MTIPTAANDCCPGCDEATRQAERKAVDEDAEDALLDLALGHIRRLAERFETDEGLCKACRQPLHPSVHELELRHCQVCKARAFARSY